MARLQRDRGEGEEVPLGSTRREERAWPGGARGVELGLHGGEESEDSDDGVEEGETEGDSVSFQNYLQQQT